MPRGRRQTRMFSDWELAEMCLMRLKGLSWTRIGRFYGCSDTSNTAACHCYVIFDGFYEIHKVSSK